MHPHRFAAGTGKDLPPAQPSVPLPLVSVLVPIYKVEPYLRRCLDSIVAQTYANLEIILVDDGSPDKCPQICDEYASRDNRIVVVHKENGGHSDARNTAVSLATGEYIFFVDSDDFIAPGAIGTLCQKALEENADIVVAGYVYFQDVSEIPDVVEERPFAEISFDDAMAMQVYGHPKFTQIVVPWNKLIRTEIAKRHQYPVGKVCEDNFTTYKYFFDSRKTIMSDIALYYYQRRNDSTVAQLYQTFKDEVLTIEYTREKIDFLLAKRKRNIAVLFVKAMVDRELEVYRSMQDKREKEFIRGFLREYSVFRHPLLAPRISRPQRWRYWRALLGM